MCKCMIHVSMPHDTGEQTYDTCEHPGIIHAVRGMMHLNKCMTQVRRGMIHADRGIVQVSRWVLCVRAEYSDGAREEARKNEAIGEYIEIVCTHVRSGSLLVGCPHKQAIP